MTTPGSIKNALVTKLGPLPVWAWAAAIIGGVTFFRRAFGKPEAQGSETTTPGGTTVPSSELAGQNVPVRESSGAVVPGSSSGGGGGGSSSGGTGGNGDTTTPGPGAISVPFGAGLVAFDPRTLKVYEYDPASGQWHTVTISQLLHSGVTPVPVGAGEQPSHERHPIPPTGGPSTGGSPPPGMRCPQGQHPYWDAKAGAWRCPPIIPTVGGGDNVGAVAGHTGYDVIQPAGGGGTEPQPSPPPARDTLPPPPAPKPIVTPDSSRPRYNVSSGGGG